MIIEEQASHLFFEKQSIDASEYCKGKIYVLTVKLPSGKSTVILPHVSIFRICVEQVGWSAIVDRIVSDFFIPRIGEDFVKVAHVIEVVACAGGS